MTDKLSIAQSLLLLALNDKKGNLQSSFLKPALAGAALAELVLDDWIKVDGPGKTPVQILQSGRPDSPFLALCLARIRAGAKPKPMKYWVSKIAALPDLITTLAGELIEMGAISEKKTKVFWVFDRTLWPESSPMLERDLKSTMKRVMFGGSGQADDKLGAVIALAKMGGLLRRNFDRDDLKQHKDRIKLLAKNDLPAIRATAKVIKELQAAAMMAATSGAIVASS
jgi:hypothetical protein